MNMVPVVSSQLKEVGYEPETKKLTIRFTNDSVYEYDNVTPDIHNELMTADSVGRYFNQNLKYNKKHPYRRV